MKKQISPRSKGFTLIELLVVMGIIVLIGAMVVPAVGGSLKGTALNQATQTLLSQVNNAQQVALAKGQSMELRVYLMPNPELATADSLTYPGPPSPGTTSQWAVRGLQLFSVQSNPLVAGSSPTSLSYTPVTKLEILPNSIIIDCGTTLSSICGLTQVQGDTKSSQTTVPKLPHIGTNYRYYAIDFRADGTTTLNPNQSWFMTLHNLTDGDNRTTPKSNFVTVEIDPIQGSTRTFRPM